MNKLQKIFMSISLIFILVCTAICAYFLIELPSEDPNRNTFMIMTGVFGFASIWFLITYIKSFLKK